MAVGFFSPISGSWPRNKGLCVKCSFLSLRVQEVTNQLLIGLVILYKMSWQASELLQRYLENNFLHSKPCSSKCSGFLQVWGQDEDPLPKRAQKICCSSLRLFLQLLHHRHGEIYHISFGFWSLVLWCCRTSFSMQRTTKSRNSFCIPTFRATTTSTCKSILSEILDFPVWSSKIQKLALYVCRDMTGNRCIVCYVRNAMFDTSGQQSRSVILRYEKGFIKGKALRNKGNVNYARFCSGICSAQGKPNMLYKQQERSESTTKE